MITYTATSTSANNIDCSVNGKSLLEPCFMSLQDITAELELISQAIRKRMEGIDNIMLSYNPSESYWATECESLRLHQLKMALPSSGLEVVMAKARIKERLALRRAKRSGQPVQLLIVGLEL